MKHTKRKLAIIADDLTGANDCGVHFSENGFDTTVNLNFNKGLNNYSEVLVVDADTRELDKNQASSIIKKAFHQIKDAGYSILLKKIDSTLRGNIGVETKVMMDEGNYDFALIVPASPRNGRKTINGYHYVNEEMISTTEFSGDLFTPINNSYIPSLISKEIQVKIGTLQPNLLGSKLDRWEKELKIKYDKGIKYIVCDASSEKELELLAYMVGKLHYSVLWVGSAGIAKYLSMNLKTDNTNSQNPVDLLEKVNDRVLVVSGSRSKVTNKQIKTALKMEGVKNVELDINEILNKNKSLSEIKNELSNKVDILLRKNNCVIIHTPFKNKDNDSVDQVNVGYEITKILGKVAKSIIKNYSNIALILTGGATAKAVCKEIEVDEIKLITEIEDGIPIGTLRDKENMKVITKAGAFGDENSLVNIIRKIKVGEKIG